MSWAILLRLTSGGVEGENVQGGKNDRNPCNVLAAEKLINDDDDDNDDRDKIICTKSTDVARKARPLRLRYDFFRHTATQCHQNSE